MGVEAESKRDERRAGRRQGKRDGEKEGTDLVVAEVCEGITIAVTSFFGAIGCCNTIRTHCYCRFYNQNLS